MTSALLLRFALLGCVLSLSACDSNASSFAAPEEEQPGADAGTGADADTPPTPGPQIPGGFYVSSNQILGPDGAPHHFHGVSRPSLEWNASGESLSSGDYANMAAWGANIVRLPVNQSFYLNDASYPERIDTNIQWAKAAGLDVIIDLHWSDRGGLDEPGQQEMADQNSIAFWQKVGERYKTDGRILFELYNEPHGVSLEVWRNGGAVPAKSAEEPAYTAVGMQQLYDAVRAVGANNIVIVNGLDYAYDLSGIATHALDGVNVAYSSHPYDHANKLQPNWDNDWGKFASLYPIFVTEFGITAGGVSGGACSATQYYSDVINYANQKGIHWIAWAWFVAGCDFPSLIADWNGTPREAGVVVQNALLALP